MTDLIEINHYDLMNFVGEAIVFRGDEKDVNGRLWKVINGNAFIISNNSMFEIPVGDTNSKFYYTKKDGKTLRNKPRKGSY